MLTNLFFAYSQFDRLHTVPKKCCSLHQLFAVNSKAGILLHPVTLSYDSMHG